MKTTLSRYLIKTINTPPRCVIRNVHRYSRGEAVAPAEHLLDPLPAFRVALDLHVGLSRTVFLVEMSSGPGNSRELR